MSSETNTIRTAGLPKYDFISNNFKSETFRSQAIMVIYQQVRKLLFQEYYEIIRLSVCFCLNVCSFTMEYHNICSTVI